MSKLSPFKKHQTRPSLKSLTAMLLICFGFQSFNASAFTISFNNLDFGLTPDFSDVQIFSFEIIVDEPLQIGVYSNPTLTSVNYNIFGTLVPGTPSNFPAFDLQRSIGGSEFYTQGSSLNFEIAADADLSDGVQASDLAGANKIFEFNGREIDNRRFHPALFELFSDGTGVLQNSNNIHTVDPEIIVDFGEEYITNLSFNPADLTLSTSTVVPLPASLPLFFIAIGGLGVYSRVKTSA